jgi:hypothetical protein
VDIGVYDDGSYCSTAPRPVNRREIGAGKRLNGKRAKQSVASVTFLGIEKGFTMAHSCRARQRVRVR